MRTKTALIVDVGELLDHPGSQQPLHVREAVDGLAIDLARVEEGDPIDLDVTLESLDDGIVVRGQVRGRYTATCRRCLTETVHHFGVESNEVYRPARDVWEEEYVVRDRTIDLRRLVADNVVLGLPINPLCREDCAGLCPRCGANRNEGDCGCPEEVADLRWAALRDLLDR